MSANRSVQAAQRRRAGPPDIQPPGRPSPQPSINSAQMFANQARQGPGPNIPNGRLAGQQVTQQQQQQQQHMNQQQMADQQKDGLSGISKMTIAQAITLITLRLGAVESKIQNIGSEQGSNMNMNMGGYEGHENMVLIDKSVLESITSRLESLEKRSSNINGTDLSLLKQQIETMKPIISQTKGTTNTITKDNKELKEQVTYFKQEITDLKDSLTELQNITMNNSKKLMTYEMLNNVSLLNEQDNEYEDAYDDTEESEQMEQEQELEQELEQGETLKTNIKDLIGTNLKEMIENEINQ